MKEGGLIQKWKTTYWPRQSFCSRGLITESKPVTVSDMQGPYFLLGMLLAVAVLALMGEAVFRKLRPQTLNLHHGDHEPHGGPDVKSIPPPVDAHRRMSTAFSTTPADDHVIKNGDAHRRMSFGFSITPADDHVIENGDVTKRHTSFSTEADYITVTPRAEEIPMDSSPSTIREELFKSAFTYS